MPICIECRAPVRTLWTKYSGADGAASGGGSHNIRLTVCRNCGRFCDKYVEHDFVILFIDLVLIKPQVYRHLLHNTLMRDEGDQFDPSIIRLGTLLLLFDVYLTWARIEKETTAGGQQQQLFSSTSSDPTYSSSSSSSSSPSLAMDGISGSTKLGSLAGQPIVFQYLFFLILCTFSTLTFHLSIRFLTSSPFSPLTWLGLFPGGAPYQRPNSVSTALLVSSSTKLFPILMVVWDYDVPAAARSLGWAVVANNVEALAILLDCGYGVAVFLAAAGAVARWAVGRGILWCVGLEGVVAAAVDYSVVVGGSGGGGSGGLQQQGALWALLGKAREWAGMLAVG